MGVSYYIVNATKKQYFRPGDILSGDRFTGLLNGLSGHALALLIQDQTPGRSLGVHGLWAGDALYAVGDSSTKSAAHSASSMLDSDGIEAWEILRTEYADITPALIARLCEGDYVEDFLAAAEKDDCLFANLANLMERLETPKLRYAFINRFGKDWRRRYNEIAAHAAPNNVKIRFWDLETIRDLLCCL